MSDDNSLCDRHGAVTSHRAQIGFTLVELIAVLALVAVLAAVGMARLSGTRAADQLAFLQETRAGLRYAQKAAVAARRTVCVDFSSTTMRFKLAETFGSTDCRLDLVGPGGEPAYAVQGRGGVTYSPTPTAFTIDPLGAPSIGQTIALVEGAGTVVVESGTGYVH